MFVGGMIALSVLLAVLTPSTDTRTTQAPEVQTSTPKPPPKGWSQTDTPGIYYRWCHNCKAPAYSIGSYVQLKIWCKEQACGDIYARVNLLDGQGTVVGWTNDTAYGGIGQKVVLTFDSAENYKSVEITELNFRS